MGNEAARWLADEPSSSLSTWIAIFQPAHGWLSEAFASALAQPHPPSDASREQHDAWERRTARVATALLLLGNPSEVWPHLEFHDDPGLRTRLIHSLAGELKNPEILVRKLDEPSSSAPLRRALIWALGLYSPDDLTPPLREEVRTKVLKAFREDADPGVHGAALWLLGMWGAGTEIERAEEELAGREPTAERRWFVNRQGMTFAVLDIPHPLAARPPDDSSDPGVPPPPSPGDSRRVALDMTEVTFEQFLRFDPAHTERQTPTQADVPALMISPYDAMRYCNWLSGVEGIRSEEYCYQPVAGTDSLAPHAEFWSKAGYRLPTDAEWTYACRAGTVTDRYFGTSEEWLARYVSCTATSLDSPSPVALRIPNDSGFFDMLGNAGEWCHVLGDGALKNARQPDTVLAGGSYRQAASIARALGRSSSDPTRFVISGFRVVRTLQ
jgi:hypothetical protein